MHIPDGYIAPATYGAAYVIMAPIWAIASKVLKRTLSRKQAPMLALGAAFSFVVMFLNIPVAGRMTAHPVGAGLVAIVVGPWAACIGMTAALAIQAVPFGDGGITTFGLNCLNMAVIMPFVSWSVFRLISRRNQAGPRLWIASAAAGYLGIVASAAAVGFEFGIQPHDLYLPYSLKVAMAAMLVPHVLIIGPIEGVITAAAVGNLFHHESAKVRKHEKGRGMADVRPLPLSSFVLSAFRVFVVEQDSHSAPRTRLARMAVTVAMIVLLAPLGILVPRWTGAGAAWGEWSAEEVKHVLGYIPKGIQSGLDFWRAPLADYALPGREMGEIGIVIVAIIGAAATVAVGWGIARLLSRGGNDASP